MRSGAGLIVRKHNDLVAITERALLSLGILRFGSRCLVLDGIIVIICLYRVSPRRSQYSAEPSRWSAPG